MYFYFSMSMLPRNSICIYLSFYAESHVVFMLKVMCSILKYTYFIKFFLFLELLTVWASYASALINSINLRIANCLSPWPMVGLSG
jgi:hypothetical protein